MTQSDQTNSMPPPDPAPPPQSPRPPVDHPIANPPREAGVPGQNRSGEAESKAGSQRTRGSSSSESSKRLEGVSDEP